MARRDPYQDDWQSFWFVSDGCGWTCATITQFLLLFSSFVISFFVIDTSLPSAVVNLPVFNLFVILALASHTRGMISNPGTVPLPSPEESKTINFAERPRKRTTCYKECKNPFKPLDAHHCSICKRCIVKMDHHCPWVNNCIGANNQKFFVLFCGYTFCSCLYALGLIIYRAIYCSSNGWTGCDGFLAHTGLIIVVVFVSLLFGLLTILIFSDQMYSVSRGDTQIDRLKGRRVSDPPQNFRASLQTLCGGEFSIWWFIPTRPRQSEIPSEVGILSHLINFTSAVL